MSKEQESLKTEIYGLLKSRGLNPVSKDSSGDTVPIPTEAEVFEFMFSKDGKDYGKVWVTLDGLRQLIVYFGKDVADSPKNGSQDSNSWSQLHRALSRFATGRQLSFELSDQSNLEADMAKREHTKREEQVNEGYYPIGKNASGNNNVPSVTMRIQHTRPIEEGEQRFRNIARIFVENQDGERILLPTTKPGLARTYVRHIAEGGKPNDERWNHLGSLCEEYQKMAGFVRATRNGQFNESAQSLVNEGINHYQKLRETLGKLQGKRGYNEYFESYTPALMEDEEQVDLSEMFMSSSLDPRIESVMPILSKLSRNITETKKDMAETIALGEWADSLMDSTTKQTKQSDDYEDPEEFDYDSPEWQQTEKNASKFMSDVKKREVMKRMHGILNKNREKGVAEGQLDEIGDTPAGRAALQQYQDKAGNQVAAHWQQVHDKSHLPTDTQIAKRNAGTVAAGNRTHGFGIAKNQQDKVTDRFKYRDAVGTTHVYQKNDSLKLENAETPATSDDDNTITSFVTKKNQYKNGKENDSHYNDTAFNKTFQKTNGAQGEYKNRQDNNQSTGSIGTYINNGNRHFDQLGTNPSYEQDHFNKTTGKFNPPAFSTALGPKINTLKNFPQGSPGSNVNKELQDFDDFGKKELQNSNDVDEGISRLKELAGVQTHPVQAQNNIQGTDLDDVGARAYPVQAQNNIQGTDLDDVGARAYPVQAQNNIQGTDLDDTGARAYPVQGPGKIEINNLDPMPLSPLNQTNVNPHSPVTHVDLTQNSSNDIPAGNKLVRPIKPLEHEIEEGAYDPEYRGGHNNEFDELEDLLSKSGMSQDDLMRQRFLTSKYGLNTPADMVKLPALKKDAEAGYKTRKAEIDTDLEKRNQQYLQDKLMDLEYQQDPGAFVKRRTQQSLPKDAIAPADISAEPGMDYSLGRAKLGSSPSTKLPNFRPEAPADISAEPGMDYSLGRAKLGSSPSTKLPNFRPDLSVEVPAASPDNAPAQTNQLDTRSQNSSIFQQLAQLRNRTRGNMSEASHMDEGVNTMLERMKKLSGM
jgi:hypothetical protein